MSSNFGERVKISVFGQSHSDAIGVMIDGLPAGEYIDLEKVQAFLQRRAPGQNAYSTTRKETDMPKVVSGLWQDRTCGAPICAMIENTNTRSKDYSNLRKMPRPGHADYTAFVKYEGFQDYRGGGHFSGRLTAPLCFAGAVCMQILERKGIIIGAHIAAIKHCKDNAWDMVHITKEELKTVIEKHFPTIDDKAGETMQKMIAQAKAEQNSVGGVVEVIALGLPVGLGEPMFDGLESKIASLLYAIPAVKGVEFGAGFAAAEMMGSENNDDFYYDIDGSIKTKTNNHGGSLGGISSGMPLVVRVAFKPTPSISQEQQTISWETKQNETLRIVGRHDPCIVPRAVPCVEAAIAIALLDLDMLQYK